MPPFFWRWLIIITDAILLFFSQLYQFFIGLISPATNVINSIIDGIERFKEFATPILEYTLWFFNVPVLIIAATISTVALTYVVGEYVIKLIIKYVTRLL